MGKANSKIDGAKPKTGKKSTASSRKAKSARETITEEQIQPHLLENIENRFKDCIKDALFQAENIGEADIVIGIPFYNETDSVSHVIQTAIQGLKQYYPDSRCVIVAAGSPVGNEALEVINSLPQVDGISRIAFCFSDPLISGKGWGIRAIAEIAQTLGADHAILEADLKSRIKDGQTEGLSPEWIYLLLEPIKMEEADLVISRFNRHYLEFGPNLLTYPILTGIYNRPIHRLVGGQWAMSHWVLRDYLRKIPIGQWASDMSAYGVDGWTAVAAIAEGARIVEANLGIKIHQPSIAKREMILRQVAKVLLERIVTDHRWLNEMERSPRTPLLDPLPIFGMQKTTLPDPVEIHPDQLILKFKRGLDKFHTIYEAILPTESYQQLEGLASTDTAKFHFTNILWVQIVYHFILAYAFEKDFDKGDLLDSLVPLHGGFLAGFCLDMQRLKDRLSPLDDEEREHILFQEARRKFEDLGNDFLLQRPNFLTSWEMTSEALKPPVPQITYREFIPGVKLVVPTEVVTDDDRIVTANEIYERVFAKQKSQFDHFVYERMGLPGNASSLEISLAFKDLLLEVEKQLFPGADMSTKVQTERLVNYVFKYLAHGNSFSLQPEIAVEFLTRYPPLTLLTKLGYGSLADLLDEYDPCDILALASWSEEREYLEGFWRMIGDDLLPSDFIVSPIKALVVKHEDFPSLVEMKDSSSLDKITSRIVVSSLHKGMGGEFPKIRYVSTLTKNVVEAERFGQIWQRFAREKWDFGPRVIRSIEGHWGREPLSAHSIFEDGIQRQVAIRIKEMIANMAAAPETSQRFRSLIEKMNDLVDAYHLALTLPDGKFVTCSSWSWASYSFKGGRALPSPLSLHVERDWLSREFLLEYYKAIGGTEEDMDDIIIDLMGQGKESDDLGSILLGTEKGVEKIVPRKALPQEQPRAGMMTRYSGNPVLTPIEAHPWESKYVLNAGVIRLDNTIYLVYRAFGNDEISRLGLATSSDGFRFTERLEQPIFEPQNKSESKGCEDPRLTKIGDRIYMTYTAYDGIVAQIALASISIKDFMDHRWDAWERHGHVFPGYTDKDAALFPEQFDGKFAMLHRVDPHIWITFSSHMSCPWPRNEHRILAGATAGMMWDGKKIGAGAQPIKTKYGWLLLTHGVDYDRVYRLGVMLLDLQKPTRMIYRSPNSVLDPDPPCDAVSNKECWVPNVVFTCGALPLHEDKDILSSHDELIVYYGAADTVIDVATVKVGDLIPSPFRG